MIYLVQPVYYYLVHPSKTISSGDIKCYVGVQKVTYELLEYCDFVDRKRFSLRSPYHTKYNLEYLLIEGFKFNP